MSYFWDIGRQYSPRWDAAERSISSGAILFAAFHLGLYCLLTGISMKNETKMKNYSWFPLKLKMDSSKWYRWESPFAIWVNGDLIVRCIFKLKNAHLSTTQWNDNKFDSKTRDKVRPFGYEFYICDKIFLWCFQNTLIRGIPSRKLVRLMIFKNQLCAY